MTARDVDLPFHKLIYETMELFTYKITKNISFGFHTRATRIRFWEVNFEFLREKKKSLNKSTTIYMLLEATRRQQYRCISANFQSGHQHCHQGHIQHEYPKN